MAKNVPNSTSNLDLSDSLRSGLPKKPKWDDISRLICNEYDIIGIIEEGYFGDVFLVRRCPRKLKSRSKTLYACKVVREISEERESSEADIHRYLGNEHKRII